MDELLKELACFCCRYSDDCDKEWTEGFCVCDHMKEKAKDFVERININHELTFLGESEENNMETLKKLASDAIDIAWAGMVLGAGFAVVFFAVCVLLAH